MIQYVIDCITVFLDKLCMPSRPRVWFDTGPNTSIVFEVQGAPAVNTGYVPGWQ